MKIIEIEALSNGAHRNQTGALSTVLEGWVVIPEDMEIPSTFPFVNIVVNDNIVIEMTANEDAYNEAMKQTEEDNISSIKEAKIKEISNACNKTIISGIDLELNGELHHFNLSIEDQSNIANLFKLVELGCTEYPYQADGGVCRIYSASEIVQIYVASQTLITTQTTYHNILKTYIQSLTDIEVISQVVYGMELPEEYANEMDAKLTVAQEQLQSIVSKLGY